MSTDLPITGGPTEPAPSESTSGDIRDHRIAEDAEPAVDCDAVACCGDPYECECETCEEFREEDREMQLRRNAYMRSVLGPLR